MKNLLFTLALLGGSALATPTAIIHTSMGDITVELDEDRAPATVANFRRYAEDGFYNDTIFHRVIPGFMIQGGGHTADMKEKPTREPIANEAHNGLKNLRGTIAMARTSNPHSATAQFARDPRCLYRAGDARGLARAIDYWLEDDARRRASASRYRGVGAQYDIRRCVGALIDEYAAIA